MQPDEFSTVRQRHLALQLDAENAAIERAMGKALRAGCGVRVRRYPAGITVVADSSVPYGEIHQSHHHRYPD